MRIGIITAVALAAAGSATAVAAEQQTPSATALLKQLSDCRKVADEKARLACFDQSSAQIDTALGQRDIVVVDREDVRKTKRSLFGFSVPRIPFFSGDDKDEVDQIDATVKSARALGYGEWRFTLEDGAVWRTISEVTGTPPAAGAKVRIRKAALGSYMMNVNGERAVRVRREPD